MSSMFRLLLTASVCAGGLLGLTGCPRNPVTPENLARIQPGMAAKDVTALLGDNRATVSVNGVHTHTYHRDKLWARVQIRRGKVFSVHTREPSRQLPTPVRVDLPTLDLTGDTLLTAMQPVVRQGGAAALVDWLQKEAPVGRPAKLPSGREALIADRAIYRLDADGVPDLAQPLLAPKTDDYLWNAKYATAVESVWSEQNPPFAVILQVTQ
ncbi:MAG: hypothetical protein JSR82_00505 [Verrucomicrobia bacterium]|nr:hypothetical protein [Verrucomicrobiota bacterium]